MSNDYRVIDFQIECIKFQRSDFYSESNLCRSSTNCTKYILKHGDRQIKRGVCIYKELNEQLFLHLAKIINTWCICSGNLDLTSLQKFKRYYEMMKNNESMIDGYVYFLHITYFDNKSQKLIIWNMEKYLHQLNIIYVSNYPHNTKR